MLVDIVGGIRKEVREGSKGLVLGREKERNQPHPLPLFHHIIPYLLLNPA